jgi:N-acyl-D-amino-acid deacylase
MIFDTLIVNGRVLDGSGNPWRWLNVAIHNGRIAELAAGQQPAAQQVIDARGGVVAPGFIDMHSHSDLHVLVEPRLLPKISQGITTELLGQDGLGAAPVAAARIAERQRNLAALDGDPPVPWSWSHVGEYLDTLATARPASNLALLVPHGAVREWVMGLEDAAPTPAQLAQMCALLDESLAAGAVGMSTGLAYTPCRYAAFDELVALYRVVARHGGILVAHIRNEADQVIEALEEMREIGRLTGVAVHISHLKIIGRANWPLATAMLELFEQARREGIDMTFDMYPYTAGCTVLSVCLPPWAHAGGSAALRARLQSPTERARMRHDITNGIAGWENLARACGWDGIIISGVASGGNQAVLGCSLAALAEQRGVDPFDAMCDLLLAEDLNVSMIDHYGSDEVVQTFLRHPLATIGSDGIFGARPHPRLYGAFPRVLGRYVRELGVLTLPDAIRKLSAAPAARLRLADRGSIRRGAWADLVVFDPQTVSDQATFAEPMQPATGIQTVLVNGAIIYEEGCKGEQLDTPRVGRVLRQQSQGGATE